MQLLKRLPIPVCGIILGIISLGNLLYMILKQRFSLNVSAVLLRDVFNLVGLIMMIFVLLKIIFQFKMVKENLKNPEMLGIFCTFPMSLMLLSDFFLPITGKQIAAGIWWTGVIMHLIIMVIFTLRYVIHFKWPDILPPWYIVYTGFSLSAAGSQSFSTESFSILTTWFGLISFIVLFILVLIRYRKLPVSRKDEPFYCINAAIGIVLSAYINHIRPLNALMIWGLLIFSFAVYLCILIKLPNLFKLNFYPSDAAFSFPFVVAASATMKTQMGLIKLGYSVSFLTPILYLQTIMACAMVLYAIVRYIVFVCQDQPKETM